ncbi:MAG TPA: CNNM domain-containing protein, partial [Abditibacteriaceae bacterium]
MLSTTTLLIALGGCLFLVALFAASEAALAATNRVRLRHLLQMHAADENNTAQALTGELSGDAQKFIATVTIAANLPLLAAAAITLWLAENRLESEVEVVGLCGAVVLCVIAFGQIAPRLLVERPGTQVRLWWVKPARLLVLILYPIVALMLFVGSLLLRPFGIGKARPVEESEANEGEHEIRELVESAQASGLIEADNRELIESIFDFGDTRAYEVMTPRP